MENVTPNSPETEDIRQRMEELRRDLDEDVQEIVEGARDMGEWRSYVRVYPWICMGAALAVGYFVVPRRSSTKPDLQTLTELANQSHLLATTHAPPKGHVRGTLLAFVGNLLMRGMSLYVERRAGKLFASPAAKTPPDDPS